MGFSLDQLERWRAPLLAARQRRLLLWRGEREQGLALAEQLAAQLPRHLLLSDQPGAVPVSAGKRWLGQEFDLLVFDAWAGFDPESFAALSGTLVAGGLLLLLAPPDWRHYPDPDYRRIAPWPHDAEAVSGRFLGRIEALLQVDPAVLHWRDPASLPVLPESLAPQPEPVAGAEGALSLDQQRALAALLQRPEPQVLIADRGRGKSATLGLAIAAKLQRPDGTLQIALTAPRQRAVAAALDLARRRLGLAANAPLVGLGGQCSFIAPDQLLEDNQRFDLILVDEAAALPVPMLTQLLQRQLACGGQIAFATTVHGYEGTGRGFALRFRRTLDQLAPDWQSLRLQTPIRWAPEDLLEAFCFRALLLDAEPEIAPETVAEDAQPLRIERLSRAELAGDEAALASLFGLLVQAHYQTSPNDLRQLLDSPGQAVWRVEVGGRLIATALVTEEGGFDPALARAIWAGQRRPRGNLLAQSLAAHGGWLLAPRQRGLRIMRIAVAESWQRRGVGQRLVQAIGAWAAEAGFDWLGSSFSASADLVDFWAGLGLNPVRLGLARDASSGSYNLQVLKGLSARGQHLAIAAAGRFAGQWPPRIQKLEPKLFDHLQRQLAQVPAPLFAERQHWLDLISFAFGQRAFETVEPELKKRLAALLETYPQQRALLELTLQQGLAWPKVAVALGLSGQKAAQRALRALLADYLYEQLPRRWDPLRLYLD